MARDDRSKQEQAAFPHDIAHVWWLALADVPEDVLDPWLTVLNEEERARAGRFFRTSDRRQFIAAHGMLRAILSYFVGGAPQDWRFITKARGKPALHPMHNQHGLDFNISHTDGAVVCAITRGCAIGVDIENEERAGSHLCIGEAYFAPAEFALLRAAPASERSALFLRLWTLKEAYVKASGQGLSIELDRFAFTLSPITISFLDAKWGDPQCWQFASFACTGRHRLSIAINTPRLITLLDTQMFHCKITALLGL
jgi:4'-phosphopantetheinyl transferase